MPKRLSIFNFKNVPKAAVGAVAVILGVEIIAGFFLPSHYFSHAIDEHLYNIEHKAFDAPYVFISDSVGAQIITDLGKNKFLNGAFFPGVAAVEMTGQYYLVKRYLEKHPAPQAVVYVGANPFGLNLDGGGRGTENFFQRCFLRWEEIAELFPYKGPNFCLVMLFYKMFPTYRYRLHLQKALMGFTNASIAFGIRIDLAGRFAEHDSRYSSSFSFWNWLKPRGRAPLSDIYLEKMIAFLSERGIPFVFIYTPLSATAAGKEAKRQEIEGVFKKLEHLKERYPLFYFWRDIRVYDDRLFLDDKMHLSQPGVDFAVQDFVRRWITYFLNK